MADYNLKVGTVIDGSDIQKQLNSMKEKTVTVSIITKGGVDYQKTVTQLTDSTGKLATTTELLNVKTGETSTKFSKLKTTFNETDTAIQSTAKHTKTLGEQFTSIMGKVIAFGAVTSIISAFTSGIYKAVESVSELDDSLTELKKVSDLSGESLDAYTQKSFEMARELSTTASNVTDATAQFVQAGYDLGEAEGLAKYSIMLQSIADETMDVEDATAFLTSTIKAFNMTASDGESIISAINEVSNQYALTSNDLTDNLGKVAGVAGIAGVNFSELIGLMTSSIEKTRNASKSANAFKSIFINLQQMSADGTMPKLSKQFEDFGLSMTESNGATKDAYQLLKELSEVYKEVSASTDVDKQNKMKTLLEDIGGKYNYNVLISSLGSFETAISATATALESTGSANTEFNKSLDSIEKKTEAVKGAFQELVWGDGGLDELIKLVLDASTALLNFASSDIGKAIISVSALTVAIKLLTSTAFTGFISGIINVGTQLVGLIGYAKGAQVALTSLQSTALAVAPWLAIVGGVFALKEVLDFLIVTTDELETKTLELIDANSKLSEEWGNLDAKTELTETERARLELLQAQIDANKILIQQEYEKASASRDESASGVNIGAMFGVSQSTSEALNVNPEIASIEKIAEAYNTLKDAKGKSLEQDDEYVAKRAELITSLSEEGVKLLDLKDKGIELSESDLKRLETIQAITGSISTATASTDALTESEDELTTSSEEQATVLEELEKSYKALSTATSDVVSSISSLSSAMSEQNENGYISQETALKLIDSGYALALSYDEQTGAISINEEAMNALSESKINCQIADLKLLKSDIQTKIKEDSRVALEGAKSFLVFGKAKSNMLEDVAKSGAWKKNSALIDEQASLDAQIKVLESSLSGLGATTAKTTKATSSYTSSVKSLINEHLSDEIDDIKKAEESELAVLEKKKTLLEETKDAQIKSVDTQISDLESLQSTTEAYYDTEIAKLQDANEELEKNNKLVELQQKLALAQSSKVMVLGANGWELGQDESAVSSAEQELYDYQQEMALDKQVSDLEALKNTAISSITAQISALESYKTYIESNYATQSALLEQQVTDTKANYDAQLETLNTYKDSVDEFVDGLSTAEQKKLENQLNVINQTNENYQTDLTNLKSYIASYNSLLASKGSTSSTTVSTATNSGGGIRAYASGTSSVGSNQVALVGDSPSQELVIGSKANGTLMNLTQGSGVVNAESTRTFAGLLNTLGKFGGLSGVTGETVNNSSTSTSDSSKNVNIDKFIINANSPSEANGWATRILQQSFSS